MDDKDFWQRYAWIYKAVMEKGSGRLYSELCAEIRAILRQDMAVFEAACGSGQLSYPLSECVSSWEATDFSSEMIAQAVKRKNPPDSLRFSVQDVTALPYSAERFDAAVISNALHIMPEPERALAEIFRVLKPGGFLFAPTFVQERRAIYRARVKAMKLFGFHLYHPWTGTELADFVARHGFAVVGRKMMRRGFLPLCCIIARKADGQ
ncbi:MAG: class I SAM-dependent methyltransferase [Treponemataceae bacterium]|nr:class I SAM-dependent methyltransferase [Treponemataceae bacterium]